MVTEGPAGNQLKPAVSLLLFWAPWVISASQGEGDSGALRDPQLKYLPRCPSCSLTFISPTTQLLKELKRIFVLRVPLAWPAGGGGTERVTASFPESGMIRHDPEPQPSPAAQQIRASPFGSVPLEDSWPVFRLLSDNQTHTVL